MHDDRRREDRPMIGDTALGDAAREHARQSSETIDRAAAARFLAQMGTGAEVVTTPTGGRQSKAPGALHLVDPLALVGLGRRFALGIEHGYPRDNWRKISVEQQLNKILHHALAALELVQQGIDPDADVAGESLTGHLEGLQCRAHMALATTLRRGPMLDPAKAP